MSSDYLVTTRLIEYLSVPDVAYSVSSGTRRVGDRPATVATPTIARRLYSFGVKTGLLCPRLFRARPNSFDVA